MSNTFLPWPFHFIAHDFFMHWNITISYLYHFELLSMCLKCNVQSCIGNMFNEKNVDLLNTFPNYITGCTMCSFRKCWHSISLTQVITAGTQLTCNSHGGNTNSQNCSHTNQYRRMDRQNQFYIEEDIKERQVDKTVFVEHAFAWDVN